MRSLQIGPFARSARLHAGGTVGGDRHYRHSDRLAVAGRAGGAGSARKSTCTNHLKQNTLAALMYHDTYRTLPPANQVSVGSTQVTWFGEVNYSTSMVDPALGLLSPFMEHNTAILKCPTKTDELVLLYNGETGGYGYNMNLGAVDFSNWPAPPCCAPSG